MTKEIGKILHCTQCDEYKIHVYACICFPDCVTTWPIPSRDITLCSYRSQVDNSAFLPLVTVFIFKLKLKLCSHHKDWYLPFSLPAMPKKKQREMYHFGLER